MDRSTEAGGSEGGAQSPEGHACGGAADCASGFCFDGVCCRTDCSASCWSCAASGSVGVCIPSEVGTDPRNECPDDGIVSCGRDGQCDGSGACRKYPTGTMCRDVTCSGSTLTLASRCDNGVCKPKSGLPCDPYVCSKTGAQCLGTCVTNDDCGTGNVCTAGSCGLKPPGGTCGGPDDCKSGICQQGICCTTACTGSCFSCAVPGSEGLCTAVPAGADPLEQCADSGATTCGTDGTCDGKGGCRKYVSGSSCKDPTCTGSTQITNGRCDGAGVCAPGMSLSCDRYACGTTGACLAKCAKDADCSTGYVCNGTICGRKILATKCTSGNECDSGFCQQGLCCNADCSGVCLACNVTGKEGTCSPVPLGQDPLAQCAQTDATTCSTTGTCDGAGKCSLYASGTVCSSPTCAGSTQTLSGRCNGAGVCAAGPTQMCDPYRCGTGGACLQTCTDNTQCTSPAVCTSSSCGKKPPGSICTTTTECLSGFCEQGVCCGTACGVACKSCALKGNEGVCSNIPAGQVPIVSSQCTDGGAASCGSDGTCDGAGACHRYAAGTACGGATCSGSTLSSSRSCNGTGSCLAATTTPCPGSFVCDATSKICKTTCATDGDCVAPTVCNGNVCTQKPIGRACGAGTECDSGFCQQGVCCSSTCTGVCKSCAIAGASLGLCTNLADGGKDPSDRCPTTAAATCGTDGMCDGAGACRNYKSGTSCASATCNVSTRTPARTCNGTGTCLTATTSVCDPYLCDTNGACKSTCTTATSSTDCVAPNVCSGVSCGKRPNGLTCAADADCNSLHCAQGFCCATTCTGLCQSCGIAGKEGTCSAVAAGAADPMARCATQASTTCGTNGFCNGSGACQLYATGTSCAPATCSAGATQTLAKACDGAGVCAAPTPATAACTGGFTCDTANNVCKTSCTVATSAADCAAPSVCTGTICGVLKAQYACGATAAMTSSPHPWFTLVNLGTVAVPLSELTIRYWFTADGAQGQVAVIDDARDSANAGITASVTTTFVAPTPTRTGADFYMQVGFAAAAGNIAANNGTVVVRSRFNSAAFATNYTQTNDYSFDATKAGFADWTHVTLYRNGTLIWGIEP